MNFDEDKLREYYSAEFKAEEQKVLPKSYGEEEI
jgi:hypothetical protein